MSTTRARSLVFTVLLGVLALPTGGGRAHAQIVNSLTGFSETEPGWSGGVEALFTLSQGNSDYQDWAGTLAAQVQGPRHRVRALGAWNHRTAQDVTIADNSLAHLRHNYRFADRWRTIAFVQWQQDPFRRIARRALAGAGLRYDLRRRWVPDEDDPGGDDLAGLVAVGAVLMHEGEEWTDDAEGTRRDERFSFYATGFGTVREGVGLDLSAFYQPRVSDFADHRALVAASLNVDLVGGLRLVMRYDLTHDSAPPRGVKPTDYRLRSGLALDF